MKRSGSIAPQRLLALALALGLAVLGSVVAYATSQPWLGLTLHYVDRAGGAVVVSAKGPAHALPRGTVVVAVAAAGDRLDIERKDLTGQVDGAFGPFEEFQRFMSRQGRYARMQRAPQLTLIDATGRSWPISPQPSRPISSIGIELWIGLVVGGMSWLIAAAIAAFRPGESSAHYVLLSGAAMLACAPIGPLYTSRELGLPTLDFYLINGCNFLGGSLFAAAILSTLLYYPKPLAPRWVGWAVIAAFLAWYAAQAVGLFPDLTFARRFLVMCALVGAGVLSALHWRRTRHDPVARAALGWFVLSWFVVVAAFALIILAPQMFRVDTSAIEPFAFLLFLLVYGGLAIGIMRYRLFDLGAWWVRIVTWALGLALLAVLDVAILLGLRISPIASLNVALLLCGLGWLPLRTWIAERLLKRRQTDQRAVFEGLVQVALAPSEGQRTERWAAVMQSRFNPLTVDVSDPVAATRLEENGVALVTPALHGVSSLRLQYAQGGRTLFGPSDIGEVSDAVSMLGVLSEGRDAYARGVIKERHRIAGDIHDNLGAALLGALHSADASRKDTYIRDGLQDLRVIISDLGAAERPASTVLEQVRQEMGDRLDAQGVALNWPLPLALDDRVAIEIVYGLRAMLRELTNNIVKHARARTVHVRLTLDADDLAIFLEDDGVGFDPAASGQGLGLTSMARRAAEWGGEVNWLAKPAGEGVRVAIRLPLRPARDLG